MQIEDSHLPLKTAKAAARLAEVIDCESILQYADTIYNPYELDVIEKMISTIGLRSKCRKADVAEVSAYMHEKAQDAYRPKIIQQDNYGCQQFFGSTTLTTGSKMNRPQFYSHNKKNRYE